MWQLQLKLSACFTWALHSMPTFSCMHHLFYFNFTNSYLDRGFWVWFWLVLIAQVWVCGWLVGYCFHAQREQWQHAETHTHVSVHTHFHTLISVDGHHNAKSRSQQFPSLLSAPPAPSSKAFCPAWRHFTAPTASVSPHGFCVLVVQKRITCCCFLYWNTKK